VRKLLVVVGVLALVIPLLTGSRAAAQEQAQVQRDATGNPIGVLGPVNALGQEVKRPPAPTGPPPRLPDGTIDLGDGAWVLAPGGGDSIAARLSRGEELPLLPAAKALMASSEPTDDPVNWCLPLGLLRTSPNPFRFIQNDTHKKPTPCTSCPSGWDRSVKSFWTAASIPPTSSQPGSVIPSASTRTTPSSSTPSGSTTSSGSIDERRPIPPYCTRSSVGQGWMQDI
jgi:hypothetical protein